MGSSLKDAAYRVLRHPAVADKTFLIAIGDRTVGGLCSRDPFVGPWQVPVADCAVTLIDFDNVSGEAFAIGERTPLASVNAPASGRMAVGEAITNIAAARISSLDRVKLSANWMAAAGSPGEDAALFDTVKAVALDLCPALGVSIPVGKDSLSMRTAWADKEVVAPVSLIVSAFAPVEDARGTLTPRLRTDAGETELVLVDLGQGRNRLGGSILAQVHSKFGTEVPDLDEPKLLKGFFGAIQKLAQDGLVIAYHDRSDGGLFATVCEMAFAGHCGVTLNLDAIAFDALTEDVDGFRKNAEEQLRGRVHDQVLKCLFAEELGAVLQVKAADRSQGHGRLARGGAGRGVAPHRHAEQPGRNPLHAQREAAVRGEARGPAARLVGDHLPHAEAARQPGVRAGGVRPDPRRIRSGPFRPANLRSEGSLRQLPALRPRVAILREQGVNGQVEMGAAFHRAGFEAVDVHMSDLISGRMSLSSFKGYAACGGFSYGDVLGGGQGWAKSILFNAKARKEFEAFFARSDTFALGICNGCQMMSALKELVPGAQHWPSFERNRSEQFEARMVMVEIVESPSIVFRGMAGSRIPGVTAHGEGRAQFASEADRKKAIVAARFVDNRGAGDGDLSAEPQWLAGGNHRR